MFYSGSVIKISAFICCLLLLVWYVIDMPQSHATWTNLIFNLDLVEKGTNTTTSTMRPMINSTTSTTRPMTRSTTSTMGPTSSTTATISKSLANSKVNFNQRRIRRCKLVICSIGNLGNQIWEYMSLFAVWKLLNNSNYIPYIEEKMLTNLKVLFPKLTILPTWNGICNTRKWRIIQKSKPLSEYKKWFTNDRWCRDVFLEEYSSRYDEIIEYGVDKIRNEMKYDEALIRDSQMDLHEFKQFFNLENETVTYVGLHYRGTDYVNHLKMNYGNYSPQIPDHRYYTKAMDYFNQKYKNIIFILITIDKQWLTSNLEFILRRGNVLVNPYKDDDRNHALVLLSNCNHSVINYGSFGVTGAVFNGGETIAYDLKLPLDHRGSTLAMGIAGILEHWRLST